MKKTYSILLLLALTAGLASCGTGRGKTTANTPTAAGAAGAPIGQLLGNLLGKSTTLSAQNLAGTWTYEGTDCAFETENLLMKAGGAVAAKKIEAEANDLLAKVGFKAGTCSFTFETDGTWSGNIGSHGLRGQYTLDAEQKTLKLSYLGGLVSFTPRVSLKGQNLSLLFESDKLLKLAGTLAGLSGSKLVQTAGDLAKSYDGLYLGVQLKRQ